MCLVWRAFTNNSIGGSPFWFAEKHLRQISKLNLKLYILKSHISNLTIYTQILLLTSKSISGSTISSFFMMTKLFEFTFLLNFKIHFIFNYCIYAFRFYQLYFLSLHTQHIDLHILPVSMKIMFNLILILSKFVILPLLYVKKYNYHSIQCFKLLHL